jgi:hypothetical protein
MEVYRVVLSSKKEVHVREPKIGDLETAAQVAGKGAGDNQALLGIKLQKELLKSLLVQVDGKVITMTEKEQLDKIFSFKEYQQLLKVVGKITESDDMGNDLVIDFVASGDK